MNASSMPYASTAYQDIAYINIEFTSDTIIYMNIRSDSGKTYIAYADNNLNVTKLYSTFEKEHPVSLRREGNVLYFNNNYYSTQGASYKLFNIIVCRTGSKYL